jgi:hypothetical protein
VKGANTRIPSRCELVLVDQPAEQIATDQPGAADRRRWRRLSDPGLPERDPRCVWGAFIQTHADLRVFAICGPGFPAT